MFRREKEPTLVCLFPNGEHRLMRVREPTFSALSQEVTLLMPLKLEEQLRSSGISIIVERERIEYLIGENRDVEELGGTAENREVVKIVFKR